MSEELATLEQNKTWTLSSLPKEKQAIRCRWVYKVKYKVDDSIERYKAHIVTCSQKKNYQSSFILSFHK